MSVIETRFRKPVYRGRELLFPTDTDLINRDGYLNRFSTAGKGLDIVESIPFSKEFDYDRFQRAIFGLVDPVERYLAQRNLDERVSATADLGYSTIPVVRGLFRRRERSLYPIAFRLNLKSDVPEIGESKWLDTVGVIPTTNSSVAVISLDPFGQKVLTDTLKEAKEVIVDQLRREGLEVDTKRVPYFSMKSTRRGYGLGFKFFDRSPEAVEQPAKVV